MIETYETTTPAAHDEAISASFMPKAIGHTLKMPDIAVGDRPNPYNSNLAPPKGG